jgi:hypothetical protein
MTTRKAKAKATTNTGILRCAQDDGEKELQKQKQKGTVRAEGSYQP